jgi:MSHA biogenesis protein MshN
MVPRTPAPGYVVPDSGQIDKKVSGTSRDRAEIEYRRAVALVNQGRVSEGLDALRGVLLLDPGYEVARQMLVALYMEQRRTEDAIVVLQQGLEANSANNAFAMLLARLMVDRRDVAGALDVLRKFAPAAGRNAEYHAFTAALYQRLSRHEDAISEYRVALQLVPNSASWWAGLAISQEASDRRKEAANSYRRARETGANGELLAYIEQRLKLLQ